MAINLAKLRRKDAKRSGGTGTHPPDPPKYPGWPESSDLVTDTGTSS